MARGTKMASSKHYSITVDGVSLKIAKDVMDDMEVLELLGEVQDGNVFAFSKLARRMFGDTGYEKVKAALAGADGRTRVSDMSDFFAKALTACNDAAAKN